MTRSSNLLERTFLNYDIRLISEALRRSIAFRNTSTAILATHETSQSRTIIVEHTYEQIANLSIKQDDLLRQSLRCAEFGLFRAAHVMVWAAFMDFLEEKLIEDVEAINQERPKWLVKSIDDLRDVGSDHQMIELLRQLRHCSKTEEKALKGLLNKRNECAHPTDYYPELNETLGYISEILQRLKTLQKRWQ
jgi:hypothetical protein